MTTTELMTHGPSALGHDPFTGQRPPEQPIAGDLSPEGLIALAIQRGVPVESFEKLLQMHSSLKAQQAKREYDEAFARFQQECPIIMKSSTVQTDKYSYRYAPIDRIIEVVQPILTKHGFSYSFDSIDEIDPVPAKVCVMTMRHVGGHSERSTFRIEIDESGRQNKSQRNASAHTYAKRYAFCDGWGIMTGEEDDDARKAGERHQKLRDGDTKVTLKPDPPKEQPKTKPAPVKRSGAPSTITHAQQQVLRERAEQLGETFKLTPEVAMQKVIDHCGSQYGATKLEELSPAQCAELLGWMHSQRRAKALNPQATL